MASWKTKLESGKLPNDLAALGNALDALEPSSVLFTAIKNGIAAYNAAELTDDERTQESQVKTQLDALTDYDDDPAWKVYLDGVAKAGKDRAKLAKLERTREKTIADGIAKLEKDRGVLREKLAAFANKRVSAFWQAFYASMGSTGSTGSTGKTSGKLAGQNWLIGPHRDPTENGSLLKTNDNAGVFAYNGATRQLWFLPTGKNYNAALANARPMGLAQNVWVKLGHVIDAKPARSLTGLQRYAYDVIRHAHTYDSVEAAILATNGIAKADNLAGNNTQDDPKGNAGGTVFCQELTDALIAQYAFPGFDDPDPV